MMTKSTMSNECTSVVGHFVMAVHRGMRMALLNAACPGLPWKPLDAAIGQLLAPYCPDGHQGNRKTNNDEKVHLLCWTF
jgi:hypothetical protein